jgi:hypothetical protein
MDYQTLAFHRTIADLALKTGVQLDQCIRSSSKADGTAIEGLLQAFEGAVVDPGKIAVFQAAYDVYRHAIAGAPSKSLRTVNDLVQAMSLLCSDWRSTVSKGSTSDLKTMLRTVLEVHDYCLARSWMKETGLGQAA